MYALTILQPWAHCIAHLGKNVENRSWPPPKSALGQLVAIHAGKRLDDTDGQLACARILRELGLLSPPTDRRVLQPVLPEEMCQETGGVVAVARLTGWARSYNDDGHNLGPWYVPGLYGWQLADVLPIPTVPCRGAQGLWQLPPDVEREVCRRMGEVQLARQLRGEVVR